MSRHLYTLELDRSLYQALYELIQSAESQNNTLLGEIAENEDDDYKLLITFPEEHVFEISGTAFGL